MVSSGNLCTSILVQASACSLSHPQFSSHRLVVKSLISCGFNHGHSLGPRRRPAASNRSRARLPSVSARLPSRCKGNTSLEILHEADIIAMKARPQLFDAISGSTGRGTTEDAESRTSSPRPMYRRLLTAASSQPGRHPQGHTIDVKLRPTFDQSSPLHAAVKQALGSKTTVPWSCHGSVIATLASTSYFSRVATCQTTGLDATHNHPLAASLF